MTPHFQCERGHVPDYVTVNVTEDLDPDGIGVLVDSEGGVTNRWADGVAGIPEDVWDEANEEVEGTCNECGGIAVWTC